MQETHEIISSPSLGSDLFKSKKATGFHHHEFLVLVEARQQQQIQSLQQALQRLSEQQQQHPVPLPTVAPAVAAAPVEDGQPGAFCGGPNGLKS